MDSTGLQIENLRISHGDRLLVSLTNQVAPGEILTVMGPSGSGKSTLLAAIIGTLDRSFKMTGQIILNGTDVTTLAPEKRKIGILFQDDLLFPHLSVGSNLAFGLPSAVRNRAKRQAAVSNALRDVGMEGFEDRDPSTLSGGQRARVALMRMLLSEPCALLLDEPFSKLDTELRGQIRDLVFQHARQSGLPVLMVTHDPEDAQAAGGTIIRLA